MKSSSLIAKVPTFTESKLLPPSLFTNSEEVSMAMSTSNFDIQRYLKNDQSKKSKWLTNLHEKPMLQVIVDALPETQATPVNPTELNCYERLKKLLSMQTGTKYGQKQSERHERMLDDVVVLQDQINKLESKYKVNSVKRNKSNRYPRSYVASNSHSIYEKPSFNSTLNMTQKNVGKKLEHRKNSYRAVDRSPAIKQSIKEEIKEFKTACCQKFINHKKELNDKILVDINEYIADKFDKKVDEVINFKFTQMFNAQQENEQYRMKVLEKDLQIETLKKELKFRQDQIISNQRQKDPHHQAIIYKKNVRQFYDEFHSTFGDIALSELKKKIDFMENLYFNKYSQEQGKHLEMYSVMKRQRDDIERKSKQKIQYYECKVRELNDIIANIRKYEQLDNSEETHQMHKRFPEYKAKAAEFQLFQKFVFNKYVQWMESRSEGETKIIQIINKNQVENYEQMIEAMLDFNRNFGSSEKNTEYITKVLAIIQKLKKIIAPTRIHQKLQPFKVFQEIQRILKNSKRRKGKILKTSHKQQFQQFQSSHYLLQRQVHFN